MSGLVDYSDSDADSESETNARPAPPPPSAPPAGAANTNAKKPFQKLIDRSNPGRIVVNLPAAAGDSGRATDEHQPPAKRARTEASGRGRFSGFGSALPPPKKVLATKPPAASSSSSSLPFSFKTSAEAAFSREPGASPTPVGGGDSDYDEDGTDVEGARGFGGGGGLRLNLPPPKAETARPSGPSILDGMKPAEEVKLKGQPLMFKPLSVARKPVKKSGVKPTRSVPVPGEAAKSGANQPHPPPLAATPADVTTEPPKTRKKVSLFSLGAEDEAADVAGTDGHASTRDGAKGDGQYQPLFPDSHSAYEVEPSAVTSEYPPYDQETYGDPPLPPVAAGTSGQSLDAIAKDLNLSAAARRELFGRGGTTAAQQAMASKVVNFNLDAEYRLNEEMRASGQLSQPARAVKGIAPGKHNLRQLVNAVASQREALEDSFATNRANQREGAGRYGWR